MESHQRAKAPINISPSSHWELEGE
jgi:hypothetical protein